MFVGRLLRRIKAEAGRAVSGGPRNVMTSYEFQSSGVWRQAAGAREIHRKPPRVFGILDPGFQPYSRQQIPAIGVHLLQKGKVICPQGWVVTRTGDLLSDCTWFGGDFDRRNLRVSYGKQHHLPGLALVLASDFAEDNFGHILLDCLSRLSIAAKAGIEHDEIDWFVVPTSPSRTIKSAMSKLNIDPEKCVWTSRGSFSADTLFATSFPGLKRSYVDWIVADLRSKISVHQPASRRLYIPRTGTRRLANEADVLPILARFGFETYDHGREPDEATAFASAEAVVAPHGAALANLVFCQPGTKVLELLPSDHCHPYYYTLSDAAGLDYTCIVGRSLGTRPAGSFGPSPFDFQVDPNQLEQALNAIL